MNTALSPAGRSVARRMLHKLGRWFGRPSEPTNAASVSPKAYPLRVIKLVREAPDAVSVVLDVPEQLKSTFKYRAGQFLTLEIPHHGATLRRCYSLSSSPDWDSEFKVTVKRVDGGRASNWINEELSEGDTLNVEPPLGRFVLTSPPPANLVLYAGGSGITPCISLIKTALKIADGCISLIYAMRDESSTIFGDELTTMIAAYPGRLSVTYRYDSCHGYLQIPDVEHQARNQPGAEYFVCGPAPFMSVVQAGLHRAGVLYDHIHLERFEPLSESPRLMVSSSVATALPEVVEVELKGELLKLPYRAGLTVLQAAREASVYLPHSCESGFCGSCVARVVEGEVETDYGILSQSDRDRGFVLVCQTRPRSERCRIQFLNS